MKPKSQTKELNKVMDLDKLIHERVRLGIMAALSATEILTFQELKQMLKATDGNLSVHLKLLAKNGYLAVEKIFVGGKPQTSYRLTNFGKTAFQEYINCLEELIHHLHLDENE